MKKIILTTILTLALAGSAFAAPVQNVIEWPLSTGISMSTVTTNDSWTTAPTVALVGRKEVCILNTSTTDTIGYISGTTYNTADTWFTIYPKQAVSVRASYDLDIFVSSDTAVTWQVFEIK